MLMLICCERKTLLADRKILADKFKETCINVDRGQCK
jgi:hypothetical protein